MWIDSICVNQNDIQEKIYQVRLMGEIFPKAERVLIWLGEISAQSRLARFESELKPLGHKLSDLIFINDPSRETVSADG